MMLPAQRLRNRRPVKTINTKLGRTFRLEYRIDNSLRHWLHITLTKMKKNVFDEPVI
jgi:hypothetical protein